MSSLLNGSVLGMLLLAASAFAMALLHEGHAAQAADLFMKAAGGDELRTFGGAVRNRYLEALTRCFIAAERHEEAERTVAAALACAQEVGLLSARGMAQLALAAVGLARGEAVDADVRHLLPRRWPRRVPV